MHRIQMFSSSSAIMAINAILRRKRYSHSTISLWERSRASLRFSTRCPAAVLSNRKRFESYERFFPTTETKKKKIRPSANRPCLQFLTGVLKHKAIKPCKRRLELHFRSPIPSKRHFHNEASNIYITGSVGLDNNLVHGWIKVLGSFLCFCGVCVCVKMQGCVYTFLLSV